MKIAIIGTGNIGGSLGEKWLTAGHEVFYGVRDPDSPKAQTVAGQGAQLLPITEAVNQATVIVLAVPFGALQEVAHELQGQVGDKVLIDTTNPISAPLPTGFASGAKALAAWTGSANVVKAFNSTGAANLRHPKYDGQQLETLICGDSSLAKATVRELAEQTGFAVVDVGGLEQAALLENLAKLWVHLAYRQGFGPDFAFKILRRNAPE